MVLLPLNPHGNGVCARTLQTQALLHQVVRGIGKIELRTTHIRLAVMMTAADGPTIVVGIGIGMTMKVDDELLGDVRLAHFKGIARGRRGRGRALRILGGSGIVMDVVIHGIDGEIDRGVQTVQKRDNEGIDVYL